jgi:ABC-type sulfate transport system substrate-binding protein
LVDTCGTRKVAKAYLDFLYSPAAQKIIALNFYRPSQARGCRSGRSRALPQDQLITIDLAFGGRTKAGAEHFAEGGTFEQICKPGGKPVTL